VNEPPNKRLKEPTFVEGLIGSAIPLALALVVAAIAGFLVYLFWFGFEGLTDRFLR
jgi:hypothetical protein